MPAAWASPIARKRPSSVSPRAPRRTKRISRDCGSRISAPGRSAIEPNPAAARRASASRERGETKESSSASGAGYVTPRRNFSGSARRAGGFTDWRSAAARHFERSGPSASSGWREGLATAASLSRRAPASSQDATVPTSSTGESDSSEASTSAIAGRDRRPRA